MVSNPRKHHYIPQVHLKKFNLGEGYHVLHKDQNKITTYKSAKSFFHVRDLNTTIDLLSHEIDPKSVEQELTNKWDNLFNHHYNAINNIIVQNVTTNISDTYKYFFEYGLVTHFRSLKQVKTYNPNSVDTPKNRTV